MMGFKHYKTGFFITTLIVLVALSSCNHDRNHPGWVYAPDMMYSEAYDAYTENPNFENGRTMQLPVKGSIARGSIPYPYEKTYFGQVAAGKELVNPLEINNEVLATGKEQYDIYCAICHGDQGKGDGYLYTSKLFTVKPTSLVEAYVQNKPDGEIYHIITLGSLSTLMGAHGGQIEPDDRWKIIHYIKQELP